MKTILVPIDFSPVTRAVLRVAGDLARLNRARLVLLHVVEFPLILQPDGMSAGILADAMAAGEKLASQSLATWARRCARQVKGVRTIQLSGLPVSVIHQQAAKVKADCIVLGSHGHGAVHDLLVGGTTQGVLRRARCPVLIVPARAPAKRRKTKR